jgi:hypothetical protein
MRAYSIRVLAGILRTAALVAGAVVALSFGLFALDETREASQRSVERLEGLRATRSADPTPTEERARERAHSAPRELIDDANDMLVAPFAGVVGADAGKWTRRGVPALIALVVYGFGLSFLARFGHGRA